MRCSIVKDRLQKATLLANKVVSTKSNVPILSNILITATEGNELRIEASDLELSLRMHIPAKVEEPGQITVPAKKFSEYLSSFSSETLLLTMEDSTLKVTSDNGVASFMTMPTTDFPEISSIDPSKPIVLIQPDDFREMVRRVVFASAAGDAHPVLSGVLFDFERGEGATVVATDSFRLSLYQLPIEGSLPGTCIVPSYALREVDSIVGEMIGMQEEGVVNMGLSPDDNQIFFKVGSVEVISRMFDAQFPPYQNIFPAAFTTTLRFSTSQIMEALKTTAIFASREGNVIKVNITPESNSLNVSAQSNELGAYETDVAGEVEGTALRTGFNVKYLLEAVASVASDQVVIKFSGETTPTLVETPDKPNYQHLVMPMSLHE